MKFKSLIISFLLSLISCKETGKPSDNMKNNSNNTKLTFEKLRNSKWIVGENGINGEKPDTLIIDNPKTLSYINTENGKEICEYSFSKDTLIFKSYSTEFDIETNGEIKIESINKLLYTDNSFKYIYCYQKKSNEKEFKKTDMEKFQLIFKKL